MADTSGDALTKEIKLFGFLITTSGTVSRQETIEKETKSPTPPPTNSEKTTSADCTDLLHFFLEQESGKQPLFEAMEKKKDSRKGASSSRTKNPEMPDELVDPQILNPNPKPSQSPISIDEDTEPSETLNLISIDEDTQPSEIQNPIFIDGEENVESELNEPLIGNLNSTQEETEDVEVIPNPYRKPDSIDFENEQFEPQIADSAEEIPKLGNQNPIFIESKTQVQNPIFIESESQVEQLGEEEKDEDHEEAKGILLSPRRVSVVEDIEMYDISETPMPTPIACRKTAHKKKKPNPKRIAAFEKRLEIVNECLKPIPFMPEKTLDFAKHEDLLKRLGLWDFVHIDFNRKIRTDILAMLAAGYNYKMRYSAFNDVRVNVSRADIARALKLPVKKDKGILSETSDIDSEKLSDEEVLFMIELLDNWFLLHEDTWMMPKEVLNWTGFIKSGQVRKVDWAAVIWFMVEKELAQAPRLRSCYYASHLELVMKFQKKWLFVEEPRQEVSEDAREETVDVTTQYFEDSYGQKSDKGQAELCTRKESEKQHPDVCLEQQSEEHLVDLGLGQESEERVDFSMEQEPENQQTEEHHVDLSLGQESEEQHVDFGQESEEQHVDLGLEQELEKKQSEEHHNGLSLGKESDEQLQGDMVGLGQEKNVSEQQLQGDMDFEDYLEEPGNPSHWGLNATHDVLRRCNMNNVHDLESNDPMEEVNEEGRFNFSDQGNLDSFASADPFQGLVTMDARFSPSFQMPHNTSEGLFTMVDTAINRPGPGPSNLGNAGKREISYHDSTVDGNFNDDDRKRMRLDGQRDSKPHDFEFCMEQISSWMSKARLMYAAKVKDCLSARLNQEIAKSELLQENSGLMFKLQNVAYEIQKIEDVKYKLEHELHNMTSLFEGYRKSLMETRRTFSEYRKRNPEPEKPLYKDAGPCGLVLSTMELEKRRLAREEEERLQHCMIEQMIKEFQGGWLNKFEEHQINVNLLSERLSGLQNAVQLLKEKLAKSKMSEVA